MTDLIEIAHFYDPEEAICALSYLRANDIDARLSNEHHLTTAPWLRVALGGYRLAAPAEEKLAAATLLRAVGVDPAPAPTSSEPEYDPPARSLVWLPIAILFMIPFVPRRRYGAVGLMRSVGLIMLYPIALVSSIYWASYIFGVH